MSMWKISLKIFKIIACEIILFMYHQRFPRGFLVSQT